MTPSDEYRKIAAELRARAANAETPSLSAEWEHLAHCYLRLAEQADRNGLLDLFIEIGVRPKLDGDNA